MDQSLDPRAPMEARLGVAARRWPRARSSACLWVASSVIVAALLLPLGYLVIRAAGGGRDMLDEVLRWRVGLILLRTLGFAAAVTVIATAIAVPLAWLTARTDLPGRGVWSLVLGLPLVVPSYVMAMVVIAAAGPRGMLQRALEPLGVERLPQVYGFWGAVVTLGLLTYPYVLLTTRAALSNMPAASVEAARSLGVSHWGVFRRVTLPLLRPSVLAGALLVALYALSDFGAVSLLRFQSFTYAIYLSYQSSFNRALAASYALVLVGVALGLVALEAWARGRSRAYHGAASEMRRARPVSLGRWKWPAVAFCGLVAALALVLPFGVLAYWLLSGLSLGEPLELAWSAAFNSLRASGAAALVTVAAAVPIAVLAVRRSGWASSTLERLAHVGYALPGIVVALALVFFGARFVPVLYQTFALLVFAYVVRFIPEALGATRTALQQVSPRLEDAARVLGKGPVASFRHVTFPLARGGILAGGALVFLTAMKELPVTLLLSPIGFKTLATAVWSASSEAFFARAAAPALLLVGLSCAPLALLMLWDRRPSR